MRFSVMSIFALALALAPAAAYAQQTPPAQPPAGQPPAGQTAAPGPIKIGFTNPAGMLLVQVKSDQTAVFEEMMGKIISGLASSSDAQVKSQAGTWKYYKAAEPAGGNTMYVVIIDPAAPNTEYQFLEVLNKTLTDDQKKDAAATTAMYTKYAAAIASMNKLNLTPMGK